MKARRRARNPPVSPSLTLEPPDTDRLLALTRGWSVAGVRDALRSGDPAAIERETAPLWKGTIGHLTRFADALIRRGAARGIGMAKEDEDIAIEALDKVFGLLVSENGDRVRDELHLLRVLFRAARCAFVDSMRLADNRLSSPRESVPASTAGRDAGTTADMVLFGSGKSAFAVLHLLFTDGERFGRLLRKSRSGVRHSRQYQALTLYELGERLRDDLQDGSAAGRSAATRFWRRVARSEIGIAEVTWGTVESAACSSVGDSPDAATQLYETIRVAVLDTTGADVQNRNKRYVMRHEMTRFLTKCRFDLEKAGSLQ